MKRIIIAAAFLAACCCAAVEAASLNSEFSATAKTFVEAGRPRGLEGAGLAFNNIDNVDMDKNIRATYTDGSVATANTSNNTKFFTPFLRTGLEWRPQERFGWGIFGNMNLLSKDYEQGVTVSKTGSPQRDITLWKVSFPRFYIDTSVALYF